LVEVLLNLGLILLFKRGERRDLIFYTRIVHSHTNLNEVNKDKI